MSCTVQLVLCGKRGAFGFVLRMQPPSTGVQRVAEARGWLESCMVQLGLSAWRATTWRVASGVELHRATEAGMDAPGDHYCIRRLSHRAAVRPAPCNRASFAAQPGAAPACVGVARCNFPKALGDLSPMIQSDPSS